MFQQIIMIYLWTLYGHFADETFDTTLIETIRSEIQSFMNDQDVATRNNNTNIVAPVSGLRNNLSEEMPTVSIQSVTERLINSLYNEIFTGRDGQQRQHY